MGFGIFGFFRYWNLMGLLRKSVRDDKSFEALRSMMWKHKKTFLLTNLCRSFAMACVTIHPYILAKLVTSADDKDQAFFYVVLLFGSGVIHYIFWNIADYVDATRVVPILYDFKKIAFSTIWQKKYGVFIEKPSGKIGNYVNELRTHVYNLWESYNYGLITTLTALPIYAFFMYKSAWQSSLIYGGFILVSAILLVIVSKPLVQNQRILTDAASTNSGRVFDSYSNFVNVFSFRSQIKEINKNNSEVDFVSQKDIKASLFMFLYWGSAAFLIRFILWAIILFYGWYLYDSNQISFEAYVISTVVLIDFTSQFWEVVHHLGTWTRSSSVYRESYTYLFPSENIVKEFIEESEAKQEPIIFEDCLEVKNLSFAYPDNPDTYMLKNVNLRLGRKEKIGIVGKSGEGKSTLVKLLLGFYAPTQGEILVDGAFVNSDQLSKLYSYVPQDTTLFQESIFYNIAYASSQKVSLDMVRLAAEKAHISNFIDSLPDGYETMVGERGVKLSLGQRQRIAIARAFLKESKLLILDEATSSLDSETEGYVQSSFEELWGDKAVIAIAHRLSTLNNVDRIIVLSEGEIIEQGTKSELLEQGGHFADLWSQQREGML